MLTLKQREVLANEGWRGLAECRNVDLAPDTFFPRNEQDPARKIAKRTCRICPVSVSCLQWALSHPQESAYGIWGGLDEQERSGLRRGQ